MNLNQFLFTARTHIMYFTTHTPTHLGVQLLVFSTWLLYFLHCIILTFSHCNDHRTIYFDKLASWRPANRKKEPHLLRWYWVCFATLTAACHIDNFFQQQSWWLWGKKLRSHTRIRFHVADSSCLLWQCSWISRQVSASLLVFVGSYSEPGLLHRNGEHCVST